MQATTPGTIAQENSGTDWILDLDNVLKLTDEVVRPGLNTRLNCTLVEGKTALILPPEMAQLQPDVLRYLHALGSKHNITLIEERRVENFVPVHDRRENRPPNLALGISLLLKQTGLPGPARSLSVPNMLRPENPRIDVAKLIKIVAKVYKDAKRVVFLPNRFLTCNFTEHSAALTGYACRLVTGEQKMTLAYFNATDFHAVGYVSNDQFVMHVFLAGGSISNPQLWSPHQTMTDATFRCQVLKSAAPGHAFGLLYSSFYIDLEEAMENQSWWEGSELEVKHANNNSTG